MGQKRIVSPDTPVRSFPTPNIDDLVVIQDVDSRLPGYKPLEYGTLHPDQTRFSGAKLVSQEPLDNSDQFVRRIYATDRADQDSYNYAVKYSSGSVEHPIYIRTYVEPREGYIPLEDGSPDPFFPGAFLVEEEMAQVEGELNSLYVRVIRAFETLPGPVLTSFDTNEAGQKVTVTAQRKSSKNYTLPAASATSSPSAKAEDTGAVTEQIQTIPGVFARKQFSSERPDMLPQKFRAAVPDIETRELVEGEAQQPELEQGDISATQTQQTLFLKEIATRSRQAPEYPVVITETTVTRNGQRATVTSTLDDSIQTADVGSLIESSEVTDLGDGRSIKVTTEVDEVFGQPAFTRSKEDLTPAKFRAAISATSEERTIPGTAAMPPELGVAEFSKTEEQITVDRKRVRTQERDPAAAATLNLGEEFTSALGGGVASVTERFGNSDYTTDTPAYGTVSYKKEELGDGKFASQHVVLDGPPVLEGQVYDEQFDIVVPYTTTVVSAETPLMGSERVDITPGDILHSTARQLDVLAYREKVLLEHYQVPAYISLELPDRLVSVDAVRIFASSSGGAEANGENWSVEASGTGSNVVDIRWRIKNGYSGPVPATRNIFFLDKNNATFAAVLAKCNAAAFPALFPEPVTITSVSGSVTQRVSRSASFDYGSGNSGSTSSSSFGNTLSSSITNIPPTLHEQISVTNVDVTLSTLGAGGSTVSVSAPSFTGSYAPTSIPATTPPNFPAGNYLISVDTESYKYGLVRVTAVVAHIASTFVA